jgi:hypothetical protein
MRDEERGECGEDLCEERLWELNHANPLLDHT